MALTITQPCRVGTAHHRLAGIARPTRLLSAEDPVTVSIIVTHRLKKEPCMAASSWQWGAENACPRYQVSEMSVRLSDEQVFIPLSAFADLGEPKTLKIEQGQESGKFTVVLTGGDAASSYTATHSNFRMGSYISAQCAMANSRSKHGRRQNINSIRGRGGKRPCLLASANPNLQDYGISNSSNLLHKQ